MERDASGRKTRSPRRLAVACVALGGLAGCGEADVPASPPATASRSDAFTAAVTRVIPIEAVYLKGPTEAAVPADVQDKVERAIAYSNRTYATIGAQFYLRSYRVAGSSVFNNFDSRSGAEPGSHGWRRAGLRR